MVEIRTTRKRRVFNESPVAFKAGQAYLPSQTNVACGDSDFIP
jgi:hypothetical protein